MMAGMVCVQCGSPAAPGRFACRECGSALVPVAQDGPNGPRPAQIAPDAEETLRRMRRQHVRAVVIAVLSVGFVLTLAVVGAFAVLVAYVNQKPPVPSDLSAYAHGDGRTYATADFSVRLPEGYRVAPQQIGANGQLAVASASVGSTTLEVATGRLARTPSVTRPEDVAGLARQVTQPVSDTPISAHVRKVSTAEGIDAYEVAFSLPSGPSYASRVIVFGQRVVVLAVITPHHAQGGLNALVASYHPV